MAEKIVYREKSMAGYRTAIVILVVIAVILIYNSYMSAGGGKAVSTVSDIFGLLTDANAEVLSVKEEAPGLFKVVVRTGGTGGSVNAQEIYVTGDGSFILTNVVKVDDYRKSLETDKSFSQCLFDKGLRVLGLGNESSSVLQAQLLGTFGSRIFVDCSGNVQACQQLGVTTFPTTVYNNSGYPGVQPLQVFTQMTGCVR